MSDGWLHLIEVVFTGVMAYFMFRLKQQQTQAAVKVADVAEKLDTNTTAQTAQLNVLQKTGDATHTLVNGAMSTQLKIGMIALRRVAELTKNVDDVAAANLAAKLYEEHEKKQAVVDGTK